MSHQSARREWISEWLLEFSVLWAVFPMLDQIVERRPFDLRILAWSAAFMLPSLALGVYLRRKGPR